MTRSEIHLSEWETCEPKRGSPLWGMNLSEGRDVAQELNKSRQLEILELAQGVEIRASSWVGRVELGELTVTIQPKIPGAPFLQLLRYAYGLRQLSVQGRAVYQGTQGTFQDLIAWQLVAEVEELMSRGLHRDYRREMAELAVPRGSIDFQTYVRIGGGGRAVLPCAYHPRTRETILNHVLGAGTSLAARATGDVELRGKLRRLGKALDMTGPAPELNWDTIERAQRSLDRRTRAYEPALKLIRLLVEGVGISLSVGERSVRLPGFLFDMNRFFQALLSRFLGEHLEGYSFRDEYQLKGLFAFAPLGNPRRRRVPALRPDFVVMSRNRIAAILDAKYRDLWQLGLPRDMLYQLGMYALSDSGSERKATILYPTLEGNADDQIIVMNEPVDGTEKARIVLRPVKLLELERLVVASPSVNRDRECAKLARRLAFGREIIEGDSA